MEVDLGERSYPIYIGAGLLERGELLRRHVPGGRALVVTNETVAPLYLDRVVAALEGGDGAVKVDTVVLRDGEQHKTMDELMKVFDAALGCRLGRDATLVALGGGVIGDMTGFAAASYQRGCHFVQVPTTLMAMVDSSVGGKTGVNHPLGKNMIGAFYQPRCVLIDTETLSTLPDRELASGVAEVIKYGLIHDADFFEWQEENVGAMMARDAGALAHAVRRSCEIKAEIVAADEREKGLRATLNLGHTFGHAIEAGLGYGEWLHGEAVGAGMCMAADMSVDLGWADASVRDRCVALCERAALPIAPPAGSMTKERFLDLMAVDKKNANGRIRLILLKGPLGGCVFTGDYDDAALERTLDKYTQE